VLELASDLTSQSSSRGFYLEWGVDCSKQVGSTLFYSCNGLFFHA
jgi:hypothetical protein